MHRSRGYLSGLIPRASCGQAFFYGHVIHVPIGGGSVGVFEEGIGMSNRRIVPYVLAMGMLLMLVAPLSLGANADRGDSRPASSDVPQYAVIQFADPAVAGYAGGIPGYLKTKPDAGQHLKANDPASQAYANYLANSHANFRAWLHSNVAQVEVLREYVYAFNGIA